MSRPETEAEVVAAVRLARAEGLKVKARSGGHSWTASRVRDGMLIDLEALDGITVDPESRTATVQPGVKGEDLGAALRAHGLFFPGGHCPTVCVGGYLLQGGFGWNGRLHGPACASVLAVNVVTAAGELIGADETTNSDVLWAVRGSGSGFFGVVTRYTHPGLRAAEGDLPERLRLPARRSSTRCSDSRWRSRTGSRRTSSSRCSARRRGCPEGGFAEGGTALVVAAAALCETEEEARAGLAPLDDCPVLDRAVVREVAVATEMDELYAGADALEPAGWCYAPDNMWTNAGPDELIPAVRELFTTVPNDESHVFWWPWRARELPDMAFSVQAKLYIAAFSAWTDDDEDEDAAHLGRRPDAVASSPSRKGSSSPTRTCSPGRTPATSPRRTAPAWRRSGPGWDPDGLFHAYLKGDP